MGGDHTSDLVMRRVLEHASHGATGEGANDSSETFCYACADARGVCRVYRMSLIGGAWKIWGQSGPEFFQQFTGAFSDGGSTITGRCEASRDGSNWETDFEVVYSKSE